MVNELSCDEHSLLGYEKTDRSRKKSFVVLVITLITMIAEVYFGIVTGSMALLADGWHMGTHAVALGITFLAYKIATNPRLIKNFNFGGGKIIALGGFASSVFLLFIVGLVFVEAVQRIFNPEQIQYTEAIAVSILGLIINIICAFILYDSEGGHSHAHGHAHGHTHSHDHSHHHHHDHNLRAAFLHVIMDALTSVGAIAGLLIAKNTGWVFMDPVIAIIASFLIFKWAYGLIKDTGWELLDGHARDINYTNLQKRISEEGVEIVDLHIWRVSPKALACELIVRGSSKGIQHYKKILHDEFKIQHTVVEEH